MACKEDNSQRSYCDARSARARHIAQTNTLWLHALFAALVVAFAASPARTQTIYPRGSIYAAGSVYPNSLVQSGSFAAGYFGNGNGQVLDVAITNSTGSGNPILMIFTGNGDGTFSSFENYSFTGSTIHDGLASIVCGPFTGAGKSDLVAEDDTGELFLIPGNGDGTFSTPVDLHAKTELQVIETFPNANGTLNLVTISTDQTFAAVLTNDSTGNFSSQALGASTSKIAEVDYLNIAGTPSLLLLGIDGSARISTYSNGAFTTPVTFNLNLPALAGPVGGVVSFVVNGNTGFAALGSGVLYIWVGNSDGSFQAPYAEDWSAYSPVQLATSDLNGDGIPDLVLLAGGAFTGVQTVIPLYGNSTGSFSANSKTGPGVYGAQLAIGDANGDGHPDLILFEPYQGITTLLNQGDGSFPHPATYSATPQVVGGKQVADYPIAMATADINGDGFSDVITVNGTNPSTGTATNTISSFLGGQGGVLSYRGDYAVGEQPAGIALASVNGQVSAFVANAQDYSISFLQGNGDGTFAPQQVFSANLAQSVVPSAIVAGVIDTSGFPTVIVGDQSGGIALFTHSGSGWALTSGYSVGAAISSMALTDINGDGNLDLLVATRATCTYNILTGLQTTNNGTVFVFPGVGNGTFSTAIPIGSQQTGWNPGFVTAGFLTGGVNPDILVLNSTQVACSGGGSSSPPRAVAVYSGSLSALQEKDIASPFFGISFGAQYAGNLNPSFLVSVADANADGINDLVFTESGLVGVIPGLGGGVLGPAVVQVASSDSAAMAIGSFSVAGSTSAGHDLAIASSQGVTTLQSLLGKSGTGSGGTGTSGQANTSIAVSYTPSEVSLQTPILEYTIVLSNSGPNVATNVTFSHQLEPTVQLQNLAGSQGPGCTGPHTLGALATCNLGPIPAGSSATIILDVTPTATGTLTSPFSFTQDQADTEPESISDDVVVFGVQTAVISVAENITVTDTPSTSDVSEIVTITDTPIVVPGPLGIPSPVAFYSVGSLGFPNASVGQISFGSFTVSNMGGAPLTLSSASILPGLFSISQMLCSNGATSLPVTLGTDDNCILTIAYTPLAAAETGAITFTDNAGLTNATLSQQESATVFTQTIQLLGSQNGSAPGALPAGLVTINVPEAITITDRPLIPDLPESESVTVSDTLQIQITNAAPIAMYSVGSLGFGTVPTGQTVVEPLTILNAGGTPLVISSAAITQQPLYFSISGFSCSNGATSFPATLAWLDTCVVAISYTAPVNAAPEGEVTFTDNAALTNAVTQAQGTTAFTQTIDLLGSGSSTLPGPEPPLTVNVSDPETITLSDRPNSQASFSSATVLSVSPQGPLADGASVVLTAQVTSAVSGAAVAPSGSVTFFNGTTILGIATLSAQGTTSLTTTELPSGIDVLTAQYSGDANFSPSTSAVETVSVNAADYSLAANPPTLTLAAGQSGSVVIAVTPEGFVGIVALSCGNLPSYITCTFNPSNGSVNFVSGSSGQQTLTLTVAVASTLTTQQNRGSFVLAMITPFGLLGVLPLVFARQRRLPYLLLIAVVFAVGGAFAGCASGGNQAANLPPAGTQSFTVSASGSAAPGNVSHQLQLTIDITN